MMNGYDTVTCSNFEHALKIYYKSQTHLVVTDIFMPEMDDIEGIQRLKLSGPRQPYYRNVRGMSRHVDGGHGRDGAENWCRRRLAKTIHPQRLKIVVESLVVV